MNIYHELILVFLASISAFSLLWMALATTQKKVTSYTMPELFQQALQAQIQQALQIERIANLQEGRSRILSNIQVVKK